MQITVDFRDKNVRYMFFVYHSRLLPSQARPIPPLPVRGPGDAVRPGRLLLRADGVLRGVPEAHLVQVIRIQVDQCC